MGIPGKPAPVPISIIRLPCSIPGINSCLGAIHRKESQRCFSQKSSGSVIRVKLNWRFPATIN